MEERRIPFTSVRVISVLLLLILFVFPLYDEGSGTLNFLSGKRLLGAAVQFIAGETEITDWSFVFTALASVFAALLLFGAFAKIKLICVMSSAFGFFSLAAASAIYIHLDSGVHDIIGPTSDLAFFLWVVMALYLAALICSAMLQKPGDYFEWFIAIALCLALICAFLPLYEHEGGSFNLVSQSSFRESLEAWREGEGYFAANKWPVLFRALVGIPAVLTFVFGLLRKRAPALAFAVLGILAWVFSMVWFCISIGRTGGQIISSLIGKTADVSIWMLVFVPVKLCILIGLGMNHAGRTGTACGANGGCQYMDGAYAEQMGKPASMTYCRKLNKFVYKRDHCPMFYSCGCANGICANAIHDHNPSFIKHIRGGSCYCSHYKREVVPRTHCKHYVYYFETADFRRYVDTTATKIR